MAKKLKKADVTVTREDDRAVKPAPQTGWSQRFLATCGAWKEEIELPPQIPITEARDPFE